jgi:lysophospholipase L1-like esterase
MRLRVAGQEMIPPRPIYAVVSIVIGLFASVVLVEGLLRLSPGLLPIEIRQLVQARQSHFGVAHPYIGHLHTPNNSFVRSGRDFSATHNTDGYGFRNRWPWPDRVEIVALGDSVTFGQTVEDNQAWPAVLDRLLPQSRVINLGLIGAGLQQYLRVYETFGIKLHPKLVLVGLFIRNDFWDDGLFERWLTSGAENYMVWRDFGRPRRKALVPESPIADAIGTLKKETRLRLRASYSYNLLRYLRQSAEARLFSTVRTFQSADGSQLELLMEDFADKTAGAQPHRREFQLAIDALQRIHSIATANGTKTLVLLQPGKEEVYLPLLGEAVPDPAEPLRRELENSGIDYLDLTPSFRERARAGEKLFHEVDGHPNIRGYALIAESVRAYLKANAARYGLKDWEAEVQSGASRNDPSSVSFGSCQLG